MSFSLRRASCPVLKVLGSTDKRAVPSSCDLQRTKNYDFYGSLAPHLRYVAVLLLLSLLVQRSDAQSGKGEGEADYSFRISLPPVADQEEGLSLPDLPLYDRDNNYLKVRDSSKDWYQPPHAEEDFPEPRASSRTFATELQDLPDNSDRYARMKYQLEPGKRILPEIRTEDVLFDETLMPIPVQ